MSFTNPRPTLTAIKSTELVQWTELPSDIKPGLLEELKAIFFFSSSRQEFSTKDQRDAFFQQWTHYYLNEEPDQIWLLINRNGRLSGYLTGCKDSAQALPQLLKYNSSIDAFSDQFKDFPAHLHINIHPDSRGLGAGSHLLKHYLLVCQQSGISGAHVVTSPESRNVEFYLRNNFSHQLEKTWNNYPMLFLGCRI